MNDTSVSILLASTAVLFTLSLLVVLFVMYYQKRLLQQKVKVQGLEQQRQQELLSALVEGQERERTRLAKDLHDDVGALLTATKLQVNQLERMLDQPAQRGAFLHLTKEMLEESIGSVRRVSHGLLPATLSRFGLPSALKHKAEAFSQSGTLAVELTLKLGERRFPEAIELGLYRVVQEMLNNTAKHGHGQQAWVSLAADGAELVLDYRDDGIGFDPEKVKEGLGLKNLHTRMAVLGGSLHVHSQPQGGFSAQCRVPLLQKISIP